MNAVKVIEQVVFAKPAGMQLVLNILHPDPLPTEPLPVVIFIPGGAWRQRNLGNTTNRFLAQQGYFTVEITYRLSQEAIFPAQIHDAKAAVRWVRSQAETYNLNPDKIGVWGHSAGGHLASLLGTSGHVSSLTGDQNPGYDSHVQAVVPMSGPSDFTDENWPNRNEPDSPESQLVGGRVFETLEVVRQANPITHIQPDAPPFLIIHGDQDNVVPISQSQLLYETLQAAGVESEFMPLAGGDHNVWIQREQIEPAVLAFFDRHIR